MSSIDVVIPCYRYGRYLRDCVGSVLSQGVPDVRVLIIDDESPDETPEVGAAIAREQPRVTFRRHARNRGHIATFNEGIDWCTADYMLLLSADDHLLPGALARALRLMDAHPDMGLCFGEALALHDDGSTTPIRVPHRTDGRPSVAMSGAEFIALCAQAGAANIVATPTAIVRTRLLKQLGGYRAELTHAGDLEMWLRLAAHASVGIVREPQAVYRRHAANMSHAYNQDEGLLDLRQRKAAFDVFLQTCRTSHPEVESLYRSLLPPLARQAVGHASSAFNHNRMDVSRQLCELALSIDPGVRRSLAWRLLSCKRLLGTKLSAALLPALARLRGLLARP